MSALSNRVAFICHHDSMSVSTNDEEWISEQYYTVHISLPERV